VHDVRVDLPEPLRHSVLAEVRDALAACPEDEDWKIAISQQLDSHWWEAIVQGPERQHIGRWENLPELWTSPEGMVYTRTFWWPDETTPAVVGQALRQLLACFKRHHVRIDQGLRQINNGSPV
jgi:hypothetical protein